MSYLKIPRVSSSSIPTPEAGKYIIYSNVDESGSLFAKDQDGKEFNLTEATSGLFNPDNISSEFKVNEFNRTFTPAEITSMSHNRYSDPLSGIELLPAPGEGKCYIIAMDGIFANYISNSNWGYRAEPYGENRSLDLYYPREGGTMIIENNKIISIPLLRHSTSGFGFRGINREFNDDLDVGATSSEFRLFDKQTQESLCIDTKSNSVLYQQQSTNSNTTAFGSYSIIDQPLYMGTNGKLEKQLNSTDGEISVRFWYSIIDLSDLYTTPVDSNTLEDYYFEGVALRFKDAAFGYALDFKDNPLLSPNISTWEFIPSSGNSGGVSADDGFTKIRQQYDAQSKFSTEANRAKVLYADDGFNYPDGRTQDYKDPSQLEFRPPSPGAYGIGGGGGWFNNYDFISCGDWSFFGFPVNRSVIPPRYSIRKQFPSERFVENNMPYDGIADGTICRIANEESGSKETLVFDANCGRVELEIVAGGTGYLTGDVLEFAGGTSVSTQPSGTPVVVEAEITQVSSIGEILEVKTTHVPATPFVTGGFFYTSSPTVTVKLSSPGSGAVINASIENGQWLYLEDYERTTTFGATITVEDLEVEVRQIYDRFFKSMIELTFQQSPFLHAALDIPEFQLEKYHL